MNFNDYKKQVLADAQDYIDNYGGSYGADDFDEIYDDMFVSDGVTGNGSGSYTFSTSVASDNIKDVIFDDEFLWYLRDFGKDIADLFQQGPEAIDVSARCFALSAVSSDVEDYFNDWMEENTHL